MPTILQKPQGKYENIYCSTLLWLLTGGKEEGVSNKIGGELNYSDFRNGKLSIFHKLEVFTIILSDNN